MKIEMLNPEQRAAVTLTPQHALVLAGAGSGKTRVLTTRMAWLIQNEGVSPYALMAVTFTNKAAREMLTRISTLLPIDTRALWVGTFHGLCNRLLRTHHHDAGLPPTFQILDSADQLAAIKRLLKAHNIDSEKYSPRDVQRFINHAKEAGQRPGAFETRDNRQRCLNEIYALYEAQCQREGAVDFAELLLRAYELLVRNAAVREHYQRRFRHILVDEFQDTNTLQYQWLRLLAGGGAYLFAVGDDDQSIYAFRGANVGNMADFERNYAHSAVIRLEQNYRSYGHILDAANALISHNQHRLGKNLWTQQGAGELVQVIEQPADNLEAQWVVDEIRRLTRQRRFNKAPSRQGDFGQSPPLSDEHLNHTPFNPEHFNPASLHAKHAPSSSNPESLNSAQAAPLAYREIAVLYRSNAQSRMLEHTLFSAGIPYKVYGGLRFFERQEIKHALAYLRLIANPNDDMAWLRVVNFPGRGIGARTLEQLAQAAQAAQAQNTSLYQAVAQVPGKGGANLTQFVTLIEQMTRATRDLPLPEMVEQVLTQSGLLNHYQGERESAERIENLNELITAAAVFCTEENLDNLPAGIAVPTIQLLTENEDVSVSALNFVNKAFINNDGSAALESATISPPIDRAFSESSTTVGDESGRTLPPDSTLSFTPLMAFLSHAALEAGENRAQAGQDAVQLMTIHAAKGLEFDTVFITGLEEGLFPHENSLLEPAGLEEERRLMYVAMTRARKHLYLSLAQTRMLHGQTRYARRSRFLKEIPSQHLQCLTFAREKGGLTSQQWVAPHVTSSRHTGSGGSGVIIDKQHFRIGQGVRHARFGEGTIIALSGSGSEAQAQIQFQGVGAKTLALGIAKLDVIVN